MTSWKPPFVFSVWFLGHGMGAAYSGRRFEKCHLPLAVSFPAPKINRDWGTCACLFSVVVELYFRMTLWWFIPLNGYSRGYQYWMIYIPFDVYGLCIAIFHGCTDGYLSGSWKLGSITGFVELDPIARRCMLLILSRWDLNVSDLQVMFSVQPCLLLCTWPISIGEKLSWHLLFGDISPFECTKLTTFVGRRNPEFPHIFFVPLFSDVQAWTQDQFIPELMRCKREPSKLLVPRQSCAVVPRNLWTLSWQRSLGEF